MQPRGHSTGPPALEGGDLLAPEERPLLSVGSRHSVLAGGWVLGSLQHVRKPGI